MLMDTANGMDFWGEAVIGGEPLAVVPKEGLVIHLSRVCLGKGNGGDQGAIYVKVGEQKTVLGYLSSAKMLQMPLDLAFGKAFELSHNMKNRSVHFSGYHTCIGDNFDYEDHDSEIEDDDSAIQDQEEISTLKKEFESRQNESASDTPVCAKKAKKIDGRQKIKIEDASEDDEDGSNDESDELPHSHRRLLVDSVVFWAAEVMVGEPLSVVPKKDHIIHLSQVCLGEAAGDDQGAVCVKTGEQKIVLGNLWLIWFLRMSLYSLTTLKTRVYTSPAIKFTWEMNILSIFIIGVKIHTALWVFFLYIECLFVLSKRK